MKAIIYDDIDQALIAEWDSLWKSLPEATVVNSSSWFVSAMKTYPTKKKKVIAIYNNKNELKAISALTYEKLYGVGVWMTPASEFADRHSLLFDNKNTSAKKALFNELTKLGTFYLVGLTENLKIILSKYFTTSKFIVIDQDPYLYFTDSPYGDLSKRHRVNVTNRLSHLKDPAVLDISTDNHNVALKKTYRIELLSSKSEHGKSVLDRSDAKEFYKTFANLSPDNLTVSVLSFGSKPVAYCIGFLCNNTYFASQKAHLSTFNYYNPGKVLLIKLLENLHLEGFTEFSFGRGLDRFKETFTKSQRPIYGMIYSNNTFSSNFLLKSHQLKERMYELVSNNYKLYSFYRDVKKKLTIVK